ncbi:hypothetical protein [Petroclostridium sp. X23]|uniref:hypothetical protein n=1 Tax=Petroclostridium sp. X23 TaxID=3045146 RepID=UPI0024AD9470|nr:hypothetical protein [Petroclostridium sp. X23]WHH60261.1 hypothetical protein QKW49_05880 [Petroclostridium sp. X23]
MIKVIMGSKGTGKTKRLIDLANTSATEGLGDVVYIDSDNHHIYDLNHKIRFIDTSQFAIDQFCVFYGFICGIISEDFDISNIYIDGVFEIVDESMEFLEEFLNNVKKVADQFNISVVMTITGDPNEAPEFIKEYI